MNYVDILIILAVVASFVSGYKNGFLKTVFAVIGNIGGAILGLLLALNLMGDWALDGKKVGIAIASIFLGIIYWSRDCQRCNKGTQGDNYSRTPRIY
jgi:uncharacterized membrane protein required for colicin V production